MAKKNKKIVRYRRPLNINIGMLIFALIFVYVVFSVYTYIRKDQVQFYEVVEGDIVNDRNYEGIILREETVETTARAGYVSYYVREGKRASVGTSIYSLDETGSLTSFLEDNPDANITLTEANLSEIKRQLTAFSMSYRDAEFSDVYDTQYALEASVMEYATFNSLDNLDNLLEQTGISFQRITSPRAGVISYAIDGFEGKDAAQISASDFDKSAYSRAITKSGQPIEQSAPVYKIITSDDWSVIFPMSEQDIADYSGMSRLNVHFTTDDLNLEAQFSMTTGSDGATYGKLDFDQYMVQFVSERFVNFELGQERANGLKIPATSVTTKSFYLVPLEYMTQGGDTSESGFLKEVYAEDGTASVEFLPTTIYYATEEYYYIDNSEAGTWRAGDYVVKPDSTERYQIGSTASLQGVYNINKGYAVFKQIDILKSNDEYYTIRKGTSYGLNVFDHIVLDASTVYEGELIYQ